MIHLHINSTDAVKPVPVGAVSAKEFHSVYIGYYYGLLSGEFLQLPPVTKKKFRKP